MATYTENYNLKKPATTDPVNINDLNGNADIIDAALAGKANSSDVDAKYTKPAGGIPATDLAADVQTSIGKADTAVQATEKGATNGVATLDGAGKVPAAQLPSYVDDVIEGYYYNGAFYSDSAHTTLITAETGKIYVDIDSSKSYRYSGSAFYRIDEVTVDATPTAGSSNPVSSGGTHSALADKVDKVTGKGLSTEDYTSTEKTKLAGIESGAEANAIEAVKVNGTPLTPDANKAVDVTVPTKTSDLQNDDYVVKDENYRHITVDDELSSTSENPVQNKVVKAALDDLAGTIVPYFDGSTGEYTNESISRWLSIKRDGLAYGVQIAKSTATAITKLGANASIERPTLAIGSTPGADPYIGKSPFFWMEVNAYIDPDGTAHVTAIKGGENFSRHNQTWILTPVLYEHIESDENYIYHYISDTKLSGYTVQPSGKLPNGNLRPFMLYAKYALGYQSGGIGAGYANTITGLQPWCYDSTKYNVFPSHNGLISIFKTVETGYSGRDTTDDWYLSTMFAMKYATKNSQTHFRQCNNYYYSYAVTVAEADTQRVIISKANAANLVLGSAVSVGANRNRASYKIVSIEEYDSSNSAVNLDMGAETITTDTAQQLHTQPWHTGACDMLETDGAAGSGDKYPAMLQGIEFGLGMYETMGNVIIKSDGSTGWKVHVNKDSRNEATTLTADYTDTGLTLYANTADSWKYGLYLEEAEGMFVPQGSTGSTSAGLCDGQYTNKLSTAGEREWLALGSLSDGGAAGLRCLRANYGLGYAGWYIGSRASANGRRG